MTRIPNIKVRKFFFWLNINELPEIGFFFVSNKIFNLLASCVEHSIFLIKIFVKVKNSLSSLDENALLQFYRHFRNMDSFHELTVKLFLRTSKKLIPLRSLTSNEIFPSTFLQNFLSRWLFYSFFLISIPEYLSCILWRNLDCIRLIMSETASFL